MCENIDSINIKSLSTFNLDYTNIELDEEIPLCLADDRDAASKAISLVVAGTRRGFISLCADVASLLRALKRFESKVDRLKKEVIFLRGSPDTQSSSCHVSQLSLSDRESLSESLQLRIINHVLKEHVDDVKFDKSLSSKMPSNKTQSVQFNKNLDQSSKSLTLSTNDQSSLECLNSNQESCTELNERKNTSYLDKILPNEKIIPEISCQNRLICLTKNNLEVIKPSMVDDDLHILEEKLKKVILENKIYIREMQSMKTLIIELQNELKKYKDAQLFKMENCSTKNDQCTVNIENPELIEMKTFKTGKKTDDSGLDSASSENSVSPLQLASAQILPNKPRALHRSKALPRVTNKKF